MEPDHKELLIGLLGSTYGEMKKLDDSIVGSSSTLNKRSQQVKQEITNIIKNVVPPPDVPALQQINPVINQITYQNTPQTQQVYMPQSQPQPVYIPAPQVEPQVIVETPYVDPNQLEFDLNKHANYDEIMSYLYTITDRLIKIEEKIDKLIKPDSLPKKKVNQPQQSDSGLVQS